MVLHNYLSQIFDQAHPFSAASSKNCTAGFVLTDISSA